MSQTSVRAASQRVALFDVLKIVGLAGVILAHSGPTPGVFFLRNFDVPLLILVAGAGFALSMERRTVSYGQYLRKRVLRLLVPTYLFFTAYFAFAAIAAPHRFPLGAIARTYLLLDGIGYVWVIRIFLLIALVAPLVLALQRRLRRWPGAFLGVIACVYLAHEFTLAFLVPDPDHAPVLFHYYVAFAVPYACIFALGLRWPKLSAPRAACWGAFALGVWLVLTLWLRREGESLFTQDYKYPPQTIYVWYALGVSHLLYALFHDVAFASPRGQRFIAWTAASTLWIYLWHIPSLQVARALLAGADLGRLHFVAMFFLTAAFALALTAAQKHLVGGLVQRRSMSVRTRHWLTLAFLQ